MQASNVPSSTGDWLPPSPLSCPGRPGGGNRPCSQAKPRRRKKSDRSNQGKYALRLRTPIAIPAGRKLRACSVARFSTDEQKRQSIDSQHLYNGNALEGAGVKSLDWTEISDEGISGEIKARPGITQLVEGIKRRAWDLIICEDSSRLYRNVSACLELVGLAVDHKNRVICIGDDVDTAEDDWEERLTEAQQHHCRNNKFVRRRLSRTIEYLWDLGAAVGKLRSGYKRKATVEATAKDEAEGPFFDSIDEHWSPFVYQAFERIAKEEPPWLVASWLTEQQVPKTDGKLGPWTDREVISLIRCEVYRGVEVRGKTKCVKQRSTGKSQTERNTPDQFKQRDMEHLRIVPDALWFKANDAIDARARGGCGKRGKDHPLAGIPRDSRGPFSTLLVCGAGACDAKLHKEGRNEGGYRCSAAKCGKCWNKATARQSVVHENISRAVVREMIPSREHLQALLTFASSLFEDEETRKAKELELVSKVRSLEAKCDRLGSTIELEEDDKEAPATLVKLLLQREDQLERARAALDEWHSQCRSTEDLPTVDELLASYKRCAGRLLTLDSGCGHLLECLVPGKIRAVPYQLFGSNKVVQRAEFELQLAAILPDQLLAVLAGSNNWKPTEWFPPKQLRVDLFPPSFLTWNPRMAFTLYGYLKLEEIGTLLGMSKRQAHDSVRLGKAMQEAGLDDPYVRLTDAPKAASRWRVHARFKNEPGSPPSSDESGSEASGDDAAA